MIGHILSELIDTLTTGPFLAPRPKDGRPGRDWRRAVTRSRVISNPAPAKRTRAGISRMSAKLSAALRVIFDASPSFRLE